MPRQKTPRRAARWRRIGTQKTCNGIPLSFGLIFGTASLMLFTSAAQSNGPFALEGKLPNDVRLEPLHNLDGYFPFTPPTSADEWAQRAERVRRKMLVSAGLWPMPTKTPLNAVVHGLMDRGDYTVEKVFFESLPGFYVTGNLYRPKDRTGQHPGILCPHGHWSQGRFTEKPIDVIHKEFLAGGETFLEGGRSPLQARCVHLARMGCVVFHYDMIGYADSQQIPYELAHRFIRQDPEMNTLENWGLYSPQAEAHSQTVLGLQTLNSIRALDFLSELPNVDPDRIGVTGASGGGTQTMILCALDPRPTVSFPAVMVSTAMQGGCPCENACGLRVGTGNIEFAALFAPKPMGLTAADDWTVEMDSKGLPELQQLYEFLEAPSNVMLVSRTEFQHNYNSISRHAMYEWFNRHLQLGVKEPIQERDYLRLHRNEMTVWNDEHPQPEGGVEFERKLLKWWHDDTVQQLAALAPHDATSLNRHREVIGSAIDILIDRSLTEGSDVAYEPAHEIDQGSHAMSTGLLRNKCYGEELPMVYLTPKQWHGRTVIWLDESGKAGLFIESGELQPEIARLIDSGIAVIGVDLLYQGEFLVDGLPLEETRRIENVTTLKTSRTLQATREVAAYTFGYNYPVSTQRVHDVLSVLSLVSHQDPKPKQIDLVGLAGAGHWAVVACTQARDVVDHLAVDTQGFRFGKIKNLRDPDFAPGLAKYGDLPGLLALVAPTQLWLAGEGSDLPDIIQATYDASGASPKVTAWQGDTQDASQNVVDWLLRQP